MSGIGDPRSLALLLDTAKNDFALSVRRAAAKGLGSIHWEQMTAADVVAAAQKECVEVLLGLCDDPEWVVRYSAISGLESLSRSVDLRPAITQRLEQVAVADGEIGVRSRALLALQRSRQL